VDLINAGQATIVEEGIAELVRAGHTAGRLTATTSVARSRAGDFDLARLRRHPVSA
jgi:UDP-glucose 6-dehydrogenase